MSLSLAHLIALAAVPAGILLFGRRLAPGSRPALLITVPATWLLATAALCWLLPDPSDISASLLFFFVVVPCIGIPVAAILATRLVRTRGRLMSAVILSTLGWIAGLVIGFLVDANSAVSLPYYFWAYAHGLALPAMYSACGAVMAAGLGERTA